MGRRQEDDGMRTFTAQCMDCGEDVEIQVNIDLLSNEEVQTTIRWRCEPCREEKRLTSRIRRKILEELDTGRTISSREELLQAYRSLKF